MGTRFRRILLFAFVFAGAGFLYARFAPPVWEARATLWAESEAAMEVLPGLLRDAIPGLSAYAIPGTHLLEAAIRGHAATASAVVQSLTGEAAAQLALLEIPGDVKLCVSAVEILSEAQPGQFVFRAGLLGALTGAILFLPGARPSRPLSLGQILKTAAGLGRKYLLPILLITALLSAGNFLRESLTYQPRYRSEALVRLGDYHPDTCEAQAAAFQGLMTSQLAPEGINPARVGSSNLFRLSCASAHPEAAQRTLQSALEALPPLTGYARIPLTVEILKPPSLPDSPENPADPVRAALLGAGTGIFLCAAFLFCRALTIDSDLFRGYNVFQRRGGNSYENIH